MQANEDFDSYEEWLDTKWQEYIEMSEQMYEENMGEEQNQYYQTQQAYYQAQNYQEGQQQGYYYQNGQKYQNGGGNYYYGNNQNGNNYAKYSGNAYQNQQMAEAYGNYGAMMVNQGMNFYYNRAQAGDWITNEKYDADEWQNEQAEDYGEYYWYRQSQKSFAMSGIADVCGALYTYAAKCNKHLTTSDSSSSMFQYSFGVSNPEVSPHDSAPCELTYCRNDFSLFLYFLSLSSFFTFSFFSLPTKKATKIKLATSLTTCKHKSLMNSETLSSTRANLTTDMLSTLLELTGVILTKSRLKHRRPVSLPDRLSDLPSPLPLAWL